MPEVRLTAIAAQPFAWSAMLTGVAFFAIGRIA
jgi:hypothetical protein